MAGPDGGEQDSFELQIKNNGLQHSVHVIGPVYGNLKYSLLAACDIFCLPSRQEDKRKKLIRQLYDYEGLVVNMLDISGLADDLNTIQIVETLEE